MAYTPPYTPEQRAEMKKALHKYMKEHPDAIVKNLPEEHKRTVAREYRSMKKAREAAGITEESWLEGELEIFRNYMDERGGDITALDAKNEGFGSLMVKVGGINQAKIRAGRPEYVRDSKQKKKSYNTIARGRNTPTPYRRPVHKRLGRTRK